MRYASLVLALLPTLAPAETSVTLHAVDAQGVGQSMGSIGISRSRFGTVFEPDLDGLAPGLHGFHVHENPNCRPIVKDGKVVPAGAAGSHYDPRDTDRHDTPWGEGHLGDLPALYVGPEGRAKHPVLAPRLTPEDLRGRALVIHARGDNYSDRPRPLGGGGSRVACGIVPGD